MRTFRLVSCGAGASSRAAPAAPGGATRRPREIDRALTALEEDGRLRLTGQADGRGRPPDLSGCHAPPKGHAPALVTAREIGDVSRDTSHGRRPRPNDQQNSHERTRSPVSTHRSFRSYTLIASPFHAATRAVGNMSTTAIASVGGVVYAQGGDNALSLKPDRRRRAYGIQLRDPASRSLISPADPSTVNTPTRTVRV